MKLKLPSAVALWLMLPLSFGDAAHAVPTNINVSKLAGYQAETTIAINPTNPNQLFVASNLSGDGMFAAYSTDGGTTWRYSDPSDGIIADGGDSIPAACCDGQATFDKFGNLFLTYLDNDFNNGPHVVVISSSNGGQSFTQRAKIAVRSTRASSSFRSKSWCQNCAGQSGGLSGKAAFFAVGDQPTISTGAGTVWVNYSDSGVITAAGAKVTGLGTVGTFGTPQSVPGSSGNFGDIAIGPNGQVLVCWQEGANGEGPETIFASLDANGLAAGGFSAPITVTGTNVGGFDTIPPQNSRSVDAEANLAWDTSGGAHNGRLYMSYTNEAPDESGDTNIFVRFSDNNGSTWSAPVRVNDDTGTKSQFFPTIAVDPTSGQIAVAFYDCRNDTGSGGADHDSQPNTDAQLFAAVSSNGGASFGTNIQVSQGSSNAAAANNLNEFGDYNEIAFYGGNFYPSWADNSNSTGNNPNGTLKAFDVYTAKVSVAVVPAPSLSINNLTVTEGNSGTTNATFTVTLSPASDKAVTVNFVTADGSARAGVDYKPLSGSRTFLAGQTSKTITVMVLGDTADEGNETFKVNLSNATNANIADSIGQGTITDDDPLPTLRIANANPVSEDGRGAHNLLYVVTLSGATNRTVTVEYATTVGGTATAGVDFSAISGTMTFNPGQTSKTIVVPVLADTVEEANETIRVGIKNATFATISDGLAQGSILDNDHTISINNVSKAEGNSGTTNFVFTVKLSVMSGEAVTVIYQAVNGTATKPSDYVGQGGTLTFAPGETTKIITIAINGDTINEADETFFVNLGSSSGGAIADGQGQGTILNDDRSG